MRTCLINARCLTKYISGIGRYTFELLSAMADEDSGFHFILDRKPNKYFSSLLDKKNISLKTHSTSSTGKCGPDVYWSPVPRTPLLSPGNCPIVVTVHDLTHLFYPETMTIKGRLGSKVFFDRAVKSAKKIACVSNSTRQDFCDHYSLPKEMVTVVHPIVPKVNCKDSNLVGSPYLLFVGTFEPRKNIKRLLYAFRVYLDRCGKKDTLKLVLAGSKGWGDVDVRGLICMLKLEGYVYVYERPKAATLHSLYNFCSFLIYPSLYEGFGIPILEALNFEKPILTSNRYSMPEVAGNAGVYVDPNSVEDIANAILNLAQNKELFVTKSRHAQASAKKFSKENSTEKMLGVLTSVL